jgi:hypothetical protein
MTPMHDFTEIQNPAFPESADSGFCLDSQTESNQALGADSRIQWILVWILWILEKASIHAGLRTIPESSSSPIYSIYGWDTCIRLVPHPDAGQGMVSAGGMSEVQA